jgi:flagellar P-ring protein precursor FlgI
MNACKFQWRQFLSAGLIAIVAMAAHPATTTVPESSVRIKDLGRMAGWRENALVGYGLVTGLAGTGDSQRSRTTRQSIANMLSRFDLMLPPEDVQSRNSASVMVTAQLPGFARTGDTIDVTVTSIGDARSLTGGTLLMAPLKGPDGRIYVIAQGAVSVGGYRYDANGNLNQKNHPTVGLVPAGGVVEVAVASREDSEPLVTFLLNEPDYTTASRVADAINAAQGESLAAVRDASGIEVTVPASWRHQLPRFLAQIENVAVQPDRRAKVVVNERTGTVVTGGDVRISRVAVSHGDLRVSIVTNNAVSQPLLVQQLPGVRTQMYANSRITVEEPGNGVFVGADKSTVADLVQALVQLRTSTRDIISILQAVKAAGAMHAELVIQ